MYISARKRVRHLGDTLKLGKGLCNCPLYAVVGAPAVRRRFLKILKGTQHEGGKSEGRRRQVFDCGNRRLV
jgi:hypothetical protein